MKIVNCSSITPDILSQLKCHVYDIISSIGVEQRQQLWNYMRLTSTPIGILYNFAPVKDQCEKYYYDVNTKTISVF